MFWKDHIVTSCVSLCVQSTELRSRRLYLILVHLNSLGDCLVALCTVATGVELDVGARLAPSISFPTPCSASFLCSMLSYAWLSVPLFSASFLWPGYPRYGLLFSPVSGAGKLVVVGMF